MPDAIAVRIHAPARQRKPVAAVVCCPEPLVGRTAPAEWLREGLLAAGLALLTLERAADAPPGPATLWDLVAGVEDALEQASGDARFDSTRIGVFGVRSGAALALIGGRKEHASRIAMLMPWAAEVAARRVEKGAASSSRDVLVRTLADLQPLRTLAEAPAKPTLLLHAAADREGGPEHALAIAMALHLDGRHIERMALAFVGPEALEREVEPEADARRSVVEALARFFDEPVA